jgi:serine/threonine-protein kinase
LLGRTVDGRYDVEALLGCGGMGAVYRVRHTALRRPLAFKVLHEQLAHEADLASRFEHEARTMGHLQHPGIAEITDFGRLPNGRPYFVMELLEGPSLSAVLASDKPLPLRRALDIARQVADALSHAHERGVVHRDLKPDNIHLLPRSEAEQAKLLDFGLAQVANAARLTRANMVLGTPHYMSPEQCMGEPVDARSDLYALGVVLYEMVTGRVPFEASVNAAVWAMHIGVEPPPPSSVRAELKQFPALERLILQCLAKKPIDRPQSAAAVLAAIRQVSDDLERDHDADAPFALTSVRPLPLPVQPLWPKLLAAAGLVVCLAAALVLRGATNHPGAVSPVAAVQRAAARPAPASSVSAFASQEVDTPAQHQAPTATLPASTASSPPRSTRPTPVSRGSKRPSSAKAKRIAGGELYDPWAK